MKCDGCGLPASPEHFAERLKRLEWATRYRPVHISVLFLGAVSPVEAAAFLYTGAGEQADTGEEAVCVGEAARILEACAIRAHTRADGYLSEFQHRGYFVTHVLECPASQTAVNGEALAQAIARQLPLALTRIRRSLRPKRIAVISELLEPILTTLQSSNLEAELLLDDGKPFGFGGTPAIGAVSRLRHALSSAAAAR